MKSVELKQVFEYKDSDKWLSEEVYGKLLMASITFVSYQKQFIKVTIYLLLIYTTSYQFLNIIIYYYNSIILFHSLVLDWE